MELSDQEIITKILQNDSSVWQYLYQRLGPLVLAYVVRHSGTKEEGEEMLQEVMIAVWQNIRDDKYSSNGKFNQYFISVARNKWLNKLRSKKSGLKTADLTANEFHLADDSAELSKDREEKENTFLLIEEGLSTIKEECQELIRLFYSEGKTLKELAEVKEVKHGAMRKRMHDCKEKLRKFLANRKSSD